MSGSNTYFRYEDDMGKFYSIFIAEHLGRGTCQSLSGSNDTFRLRELAYPPLPREIAPRFVYAHYYGASDGTGMEKSLSKARQRKFIIGNLQSFELLRGELPSILLLDYPGYPKKDYYIPTKLIGEVYSVIPRLDDPYYLGLPQLLA